MRALFTRVYIIHVHTYDRIDPISSNANRPFLHPDRGKSESGKFLLRAPRDSSTLQVDGSPHAVAAAAAADPPPLFLSRAEARETMIGRDDGETRMNDEV